MKNKDNLKNVEISYDNIPLIPVKGKFNLSV